MLGGGFVVMSHALDHAGHNCNLLTQAESLVMTKEHPIEHYGTCAGRSAAAARAARSSSSRSRTPIRASTRASCRSARSRTRGRRRCSTRSTTSACSYLENPTRVGPRRRSTTRRRSAAFFDHPNLANPIRFTTVIPNSGDPSRSLPGRAGRPGLQRADEPATACAARSRTTWSTRSAATSTASPAAASTTSASSTGSKGLREGRISPAQFVDLNAKIGGADIDLNLTPERTAADPIALERLYRTGAINSANNLDKVAIIDLRGPDPGAFHDVYRTYAMRARLERNFGTAANQILWRGQAPLIGDPSFADEAMFADGPLAGPRSRRPPQGPAGAEDHPGQARHRRRRAAPTGTASDAAVRGVRPDGHRPTARRARAPTAPERRTS